MSRETDLSAVAGEAPTRSVERERDAVGDHPDTGPLVSEDHAQQSPAADVVPEGGVLDDAGVDLAPVVAPPD